jgi:hypothetical protein
MHYCERLQGGETVAHAAAVKKLTLLRVSQHRLTPGRMHANRRRMKRMATLVQQQGSAWCEELCSVGARDYPSQSIDCAFPKQPST